jgi:hypothetical protein
MRPARESNMYRLGNKREVASALDKLALELKIVLCRQVKEGRADRLAYLVGDLRILPKELYNLSGQKQPQRPQTKKCKTCESHKLLAEYAKGARSCNDCTPPPKQAETMRDCMICGIKHPLAAFSGKMKRCIATESHHAQHKRDVINVVVRARHAKKRAAK